MPKIKCDMCGKTKVVVNHLSNYAYKRKYDGKVHYYCSYNCMRKSEKEHPQKYQDRLM